MNTFIMKNDLAGHGEDAAFVCDGFAVVCDGLGGSGQGKVNFDGEEQTEAKTASTLCSLAVREFFNEAVINDWRTFMAENLSPDDRREYLEEMTYALRHHIVDFMKKKCAEHGVDTEKIKALPTTLALALYMETPECTEVTAIWAGDSRVYTLSPTGGLQQLSRDDTVEDDFDANEQIGSSTMTGCVTYAYPFKLGFLHHRLENSPNRLIFCCSDGCFDGLKSIMIFEYILLDKLMALSDDAAPESFIEDVKSAYLLGEVYGGGLIDDTSLAGKLFCVTDVKTLKKEYLARYANIKEIREIVEEWLKELLMIARPSPEEDTALAEEYGSFAVRTAITALENKPSDWEEQILSEAVVQLPVFARFRARRAEIAPPSDPVKLAEDVSLAEIRREFDDAFVKLLCFSRENRAFMLRKLERGLAAHLGFELDSFADSLERSEQFLEMRDELLEALYDVKCFYDLFEDGSGTRREFLESLSDTVGQLRHTADLSYRILGTDHGPSEDILENERRSIIAELDDNGITSEGFSIWYDMGMPPFGDERNYERLEQLTAELPAPDEESGRLDPELVKLLKDLVHGSKNKITEQFLHSPAIIFSSCLDEAEGIGELREWLSAHMSADKQADAAYEQVGKIWRFHYKSMYEQYKKAQTGGRA